MFFDHFAHKGIFVDDDFTSSGDIQILKRDRLEVCAMNEAQRFGRGRRGSRVPDAKKIGRQVHPTELSLSCPQAAKISSPRGLRMKQGSERRTIDWKAITRSGSG